MAYNKVKLNPIIAPTVRAEHHNCLDVHYVLVIPKSTNTQSQSTNDTSKDTKIMATQLKSEQQTFLTSTCYAEAFHASLFLSLENEGVLTIPEAHSSLKSQGLSGKNNHAYVCLRTSKAYYLTTEEKLSLPSSQRLMNWGMTVNGKCLTARISESPKTENGCSLSDILEEQVDQKYFLSLEQTRKLLNSLSEEVKA